MPKHSPLTAYHHANWRYKAIMNANLGEEGSLHYTDVVSHSRADLRKLKELLLQTIDEWRSTVKESAEEELSCLCLDFFSV